MRWHAVSMVLFTVAVLSLDAPAARAGLAEWQTEVSTGTANVFVDTNIAAPTTRNIGALAGDRTFEFLVNASDAGGSSCLISRYDSSPWQAIKFEQSGDTLRYGITRWGMVDYVIPDPPITVGEPVHLAFVVKESSGFTTLFVNGIAREWIPELVVLDGTVAVGQATPSGGDPLTGTILGIATYDSVLPTDELRAHTRAYFGADQPPPPRALLRAVHFSLARYYLAQGPDPVFEPGMEITNGFLESSLEDDYWTDDDSLSAAGTKVFSILPKAIKNLQKTVEPLADGDALVDVELAYGDLARVCDLLLLEAIADATDAAGGDPKAQKSIAKAQAAWTAGSAAEAAGLHLEAIKAYKKGWAAAVKVLR